ncbi:hypothetical protein BpHYR1_021556, partial [Brachionus plicatilis]
FASKEENKWILDEWKKLTFNQKVLLIKQKYPNLSIDNVKSQINLTNIMVNDAEDFIKKNDKYKQLRKLIREQEANEDKAINNQLNIVYYKPVTNTNRYHRIGYIFSSGIMWTQSIQSCLAHCTILSLDLKSVCYSFLVVRFHEYFQKNQRVLP